MESEAVLVEAQWSLSRMRRRDEDRLGWYARNVLARAVPEVRLRLVYIFCMIEEDEEYDGHCDRATCANTEPCECVCVGCVMAKCEEQGIVPD